MATLKEKLAKFYNDESKHSRYQNIPDFVKADTGYEEELIPLWRSDLPRYDYLLEVLKALPFNSLLDVGANTGFFSLMLSRYQSAKEITALELNSNHLEFINIIKDNYSIDNLSTLNLPLNLENIERLNPYDVVLFFNVLHHAGADFDKNHVPTLDDFEDYAIDYMTRLGKKCNYIFFQMGYNWGGNKKTPIIALEDDAEKVVFTNRVLKNSNWQIERIAYPKLHGNQEEYLYYEVDQTFLENLDNKDYLNENLDSERLSKQSEFFRRPIFVCRSLASGK